MTLATRKKVFLGAIVVLNLANVCWFLINVLDGMTVWMSALNLLWHLVLLNVLAVLLWRGGEISKGPATNKTLP
jgi:hypothetical protein